MAWVASRVRHFWQWVRHLPKKITITVFIILLIVLTFGSYQLIRFYSYVQEDPNFCRSCHLMEKSWDRWAVSEHREVGCHSCHQQSWLTSTKLLYDATIGGVQKVEEHAVVPDKACEKCHESGSSQWLQVAATAGHRVHAEEQNIACVKCHSVSLHRFEPPGPICSVCHEEKHIEISGMASMHCTTCHEFLAEKAQLLPSRKTCLDCHQALAKGEITWPANAPMQYACSDCHQPHLQAKPVVDCLSCHSVAGLHLRGEHSTSSCQTCHQPHEWQVTKRETCLTCHPGKAEHNPGILCANCHSFPAK